MEILYILFGIVALAWSVALFLMPFCIYSIYTNIKAMNERQASRAKLLDDILLARPVGPENEDVQVGKFG